MLEKLTSVALHFSFSFSHKDVVQTAYLLPHRACMDTRVRLLHSYILFVYCKGNENENLPRMVQNSSTIHLPAVQAVTSSEQGMYQLPKPHNKRKSIHFMNDKLMKCILSALIYNKHLLSE